MSLPSAPVPLPGRTAGQMARSAAGYAVLMGLMLISPLFVFIPAALFQCGIRNGKRVLWAALVIGTALAVFVTVQSARAPGTAPNDVLMAYSYLLALVLAIVAPAMVVLPFVAKGEAFGRVLMIALVGSVVGLAGTEVVMRTTTGFSPYAEQVVKAQQTSAQFVAVYEKAGVPSDALRMIRRVIDFETYCLPALFLMSVTVTFVLSMVMFGRIHAWRRFVETREGPAPGAGTYLFRNLSLPEWLLFAFIIGGITPLASGIVQKVAANTLAVVLFLYLLQGLAIFRSMLAAVGAGFAGIMFGYLLLAFLTITGIAPLLLSVAGLFDSFFDFRHFKRKDHTDESHFD